RLPGARLARHLGALRAPAIPLEGDRADPACAGLEHPRAHCRAYCRRTARRDAVRTRKTLSAGALRVLRGLAIPDMADIGGARGCLGTRVDRPLSLAPNEAVLQACRAIPAVGCRAASH